MKAYLADVIRELPVSLSEQRVAMARFSDKVEVEFLMDEMSSTSSITKHIEDKLQHTGGNTNTAEALKWTQSYIEKNK